MQRGAERAPGARKRREIQRRRERRQQSPNVAAKTKKIKRSNNNNVLLVAAASVNVVLAVVLFAIVNVTPYFVFLHTFRRQNNLAVSTAAGLACLCMVVIDFWTLSSVDTKGPRRSQVATSKLPFPGSPEAFLLLREL